MNKSLVIVFLSILTVNGFSQTSKTNEQAKIIIPFHLFDGFILIDAEINELKGKFLLDTASPFDFFLNHEKIPLDTTNIIGEGAAGSGQKIVVHKSNEHLSIKIEGFSDTIIKP